VTMTRRHARQVATLVLAHARRHRCCERSEAAAKQEAATLRLAFLAPQLVKAAVKAIADYKKAIGEPGGLAELSIFYCEEAVSLLDSCAFEDERYFVALIRIVEDGDRHGDTINLTARLQQLAHPNGICVSDKVRIEVESKVEIQFESGGEQRLKNIAQATKVFHWRPEGALPLVLTSAGAEAVRDAVPAKGGAKPSLALSPFEVLGGGAQAVPLATGVNEAVASSPQWKMCLRSFLIDLPQLLGILLKDPAHLFCRRLPTRNRDRNYAGGQLSHCPWVQ
jgi:hypothetical protein